MLFREHEPLTGGIFITFSGNCKKALTFYQGCFGGHLHFETFETELRGFTEAPVISGSLVAERIVIHGSDLVHSEGRKIGNYLSVFVPCKDAAERKLFIKQLSPGLRVPAGNYEAQALIEITDAFDVRWVLGL